ncbi:unnamed protein product [Ixodes pacificus]
MEQFHKRNRAASCGISGIRFKRNLGMFLVSCNRSLQVITLVTSMIVGTLKYPATKPRFVVRSDCRMAPRGCPSS